MNKKFLILVALIGLGIIVIVVQVGNDKVIPDLPSGVSSTSTATTTDGEAEPQDKLTSRIETRINQGTSALDVKVVPLELLEDSRCPINAVCIQAGTVRVRALLTSGLGVANQVFVLNQPITTEAEIVTLVDVEPEIIDPGEIKLNQYRFVFEIAKR